MYVLLSCVKNEEHNTAKKSLPLEPFIGELVFTAVDINKLTPGTPEDNSSEKINITKDYINQQMWQSIMGSNPSNSKNYSQAVTGYSPEDCLSFIEKFNTIYGVKVRLPSKKEFNAYFMNNSMTINLSQLQNPDETLKEEPNKNSKITILIRDEASGDLLFGTANILNNEHITNYYFTHSETLGNELIKTDTDADIRLLLVLEN